jgi:GNAT superfamily N-acetyltransferase
VAGWTIRALGASEPIAPLTALLHRAYGALGARGLNYTAVDQDDAVTARRARKGTCLVAEEAGAVVGTLSLHGPEPASENDWFTRPGGVVLEQFAVEPGLQRRGLGRALMAEAERRAREGGATHLVGDTAEPATHLIAFYERLGYRVVDRVRWPGKTYVSVVLVKALSPPAPR